MNIIFTIVRISLIICFLFALTNPIEAQESETLESESQEANITDEESTPVEVTLRWFIQGDEIAIEAFADPKDVKRAEESISNPKYNSEPASKRAVIEVITGADKTAVEALQTEIKVDSDGNFGSGAWTAFVAYLVKKRNTAKLEFGNRIIKPQPPKNILYQLQNKLDKEIGRLNRELTKLREQIVEINQKAASNETRLEKLEKKKLALILSVIGIAVAIGIGVTGFILARKTLGKSNERLEGIEQKVENLSQTIENSKNGVEEKFKTLHQELQGYQTRIEGLETNQKEYVKKSEVRVITGLETFISTREEHYKQTQSEEIDLKELENFQADLSSFDSSLEQIEELLVSNRENFANVREKQVASVSRKVDAIYEAQTQPPDDIEKSLPERWLDVIKRETGVQVDESFESLRKQVNFKSLVQFFARHIDKEYQSETQNEASIEAIFRGLLQFANLTEIRPNMGERYNPRHHYILREERRLDVPQGAIARTYLRGFMENGEVISKAQVIIGR